MSVLGYVLIATDRFVPTHNEFGPDDIPVWESLNYFLLIKSSSSTAWGSNTTCVHLPLKPHAP